MKEVNNMSIIKITIMNEDKQAAYNLLGYSFQPADAEKATILTINTSVSSIKYRIWADDNVKDINNIKSFISSQFEDALLNNKTIFLKEEPSRNYLYFGNDNTSSKMFSGSKL